MKKLLSLLLCIVFVCFALVGCAEDVIGEYLDNYNTNKVTDDKIEKLNFYIVTGDSTSAEAKITVPQNINAYIKEKYHVELNVVYCTAAEYEATLSTAMNKTAEAERPDIVLITSKGMFDTMYENNNLVALNDFYNHRDFRSINTIVDRALLSASSVLDATTGTTTYFTVPNNHVIGEYKYVVIDKAMVRDTLHFSDEEIETMTTEQSLEELVEALEYYYAANGAEFTEEEYAKYVNVVTGSYADKLLLEYGVSSAEEITADSSKVNFVNVNSYPNATAEEAFSSAFGIVKHLDDEGKSNSEEKQAALDSHYTKCMKIIFALNTDAQLKNMLQYGYVGTNYRFIKNQKNENTNYIKLEKSAEVVYEMNPIYTGNLFISYYCEEIGWTETLHNDILKQNADSKTPAQKANTELSALSLSVKTADANVVLDLPKFGAVYSDVVLTWTSSNSDVAVVNEDGTLTFNNPAENTQVVITVNVSIAGVEGSKEFTVTVQALNDGE